MGEIKSLSCTGESEGRGVNQCLEIPLFSHCLLDEPARMGWASCAALGQPPLAEVCSTLRMGKWGVRGRDVT